MIKLLLITIILLIFHSGIKKYLNNLYEWWRIVRKKNYWDLTFGGVQDLYKKAQQAHPNITIKIFKGWLYRQQTAHLSNKPISKNDFKPIYAKQSYSF